VDLATVKIPGRDGIELNCIYAIPRVLTSQRATWRTSAPMCDVYRNAQLSREGCNCEDARIVKK